MLYVTDWKRNTKMRQYQIRITELAEEDIENAGDYIAHELKNPSAAENTVSEIRAKINSLADFPERNELDEDELLTRLGVQKDYYRNYKIYYMIEGDTIYIVRILHMLVDSKAWLYPIMAENDFDRLFAYLKAASKAESVEKFREETRL